MSLYVCVSVFVHARFRACVGVCICIVCVRVFMLGVFVCTYLYYTVEGKYFKALSCLLKVHKLVQA